MMVVPDFMSDVRTWLRSDASLHAIHSGRVFYRVPDRPSGYPLVRILQSGGGPTEFYTPIFTARIQCHLWGNAMKMYDTIRLLTRTLESAAWNLPEGILGPGGTYVLSCSPNATVDLPDPETGWPRKIVTLLLRMRMSGSGDQDVP